MTVPWDSEAERLFDGTGLLSLREFGLLPVPAPEEDHEWVKNTPPFVAFMIAARLREMGFKFKDDSHSEYEAAIAWMTLGLVAFGVEWKEAVAWEIGKAGN